MFDFSGDVRRGAVRIEVLANKMRKQMEADTKEYPNSRELALEMKRIYGDLVSFAERIEKALETEEVQVKSIWATEQEVQQPNVLKFKPRVEKC